MKGVILGKIALLRLDVKYLLSKYMEVVMKNRKWIIVPISMVMLFVLLTGCKKNNQSEEDNSVTPKPTTQPTVTTPAEDTSEELENVTIQDYYPFQADTEYVYTGEGNEYASYHRYIDFVDSENKKFQTRTNNGGTETVRVIEIKDGKISVVSIVNECYYRDNIMSAAAAVKEKPEVLLMEPLVQGTQWNTPDGSKRYISGVEVTVETPTGNYKAIEVTTEGEDSTTKNYYAPQVGLVKEVFLSNDMEVSSTLSEINANTPFTQTVEVFYPDTDEKIYVEPISLIFHTGDDTKDILREALRTEGSKESYLQIASDNTKINTLYLNKDNIVSVDFSSEFVQDMNLGAGYEWLVLQSVTNTLGNYYGVQKVNITLDGKPYESGHVSMEVGEAFEVNMEKVIR
jgi:hypothetical protein